MNEMAESTPNDFIFPRRNLRRAKQPLLPNKEVADAINVPSKRIIPSAVMGLSLSPVISASSLGLKYLPASRDRPLVRARSLIVPSPPMPTLKEEKQCEGAGFFSQRHGSNISSAINPIRQVLPEVSVEAFLRASAKKTTNPRVYTRRHRVLETPEPRLCPGLPLSDELVDSDCQSSDVEPADSIASPTPRDAGASDAAKLRLRRAPRGAGSDRTPRPGRNFLRRLERAGVYISRTPGRDGTPPLDFKRDKPEDVQGHRVSTQRPATAIWRPIDATLAFPAPCFASLQDSCLNDMNGMNNGRAYRPVTLWDAQRFGGMERPSDPSRSPLTTVSQALGPPKPSTQIFQIPSLNFTSMAGLKPLGRVNAARYIAIMHNIAKKSLSFRGPSRPPAQRKTKPIAEATMHPLTFEVSREHAEKRGCR
ncbi:hypothetical protein FRB99_007104 [Tulasnella sp. 403]|nr:hypothetical protein FRB99_007104 [Tulasnella sp. 403]